MQKSDFFKQGEKVLIRTVTNYQVGRVKVCGDDFIILSDASWVADTGRFNKALTTGELNEVEHVPGEFYVSIGSIVDACKWLHDLPSGVK